MKIKKRYFIIIPILTIFIFAALLFSLDLYLRLWENVERIMGRLEGNQLVRSVEYVEDAGYLFLDLRLKITLVDGRKLELAGVSSYLTCVSLISIGEYNCCAYIFDNPTYSERLRIKLLEETLSIPLNKVNDVIKNYDAIYRYISALPDQNSPEYVDIEAPDYNRFFDPDMKLNIIEWSGNSYVLFKSDIAEDKRSVEKIIKEWKQWMQENNL